MTGTSLIAAALLAAAVDAAAAEPVIARPGESARLASAAFDMEMTVGTAADGLLEVRALFVPRDGAAPMHIAMAMAEGDAVAFGLPRRPAPLWRFARRGGAVEAALDEAPSPPEFALR